MEEIIDYNDCYSKNTKLKENETAWLRDLLVNSGIPHISGTAKATNFQKLSAEIKGISEQSVWLLWPWGLAHIGSGEKGASGGFAPKLNMHTCQSFFPAILFKNVLKMLQNQSPITFSHTGGYRLPHHPCASLKPVAEIWYRVTVTGLRLVKGRMTEKCD